MTRPTPTARAVERVIDGSQRLSHRLGGWVAATDTNDRRPATIAGRAAGAGLGAWAAVQTGSGILLLAVPAWIAAAWHHSGPALERDFADHVRALIGDRTGIHLDELHTVLVDGGLDWDRARLRSALAAAGIPVRQSLRIGDVVRTGVHRDDLPSPTPRLPPFRRQKAGQSDVEQPEEGM